MSAKNQLPFVPAVLAVRGAFNALNGVQRMRAGEQVAGIAVLLYQMADQLGIDPSELLNKARRWSTDADTYYTREVKALRDYIKGELR